MFLEGTETIFVQKLRPQCDVCGGSARTFILRSYIIFIKQKLISITEGAVHGGQTQQDGGGKTQESATVEIG